jgi:hypothetical protein
MHTRTKCRAVTLFICRIFNYLLLATCSSLPLLPFPLHLFIMFLLTSPHLSSPLSLPSPPLSFTPTSSLTLSFLFIPPLLPSLFSSSFAFSFRHSLAPYLSLISFRLSPFLFSSLPTSHPHLSSPPLSSPNYLRANTRKVITAVTMGHDART